MRRHILVINRFDNESGRYHRYIDHAAHAVSYITNRSGARPVDHAVAEAVVTVDDLSDYEEVQRQAKVLAGRYGDFDCVLALSEFDIELGAVLRELLKVRGPDSVDVRRWRDKVTMKELLAAAGLRVPRFRLVTSPGEIREFAAEVGFPVVLKPRAGWDSQGIFVVKSPVTLDSLIETEQLDQYECEEFIQGQMYHIDGVAQNGRVRTMRSSRLTATCLDFALGNVFGSVANDDAHLEDRLRSYTQQVVDALRMGTSAFHLELFRTPVPAGYEGTHGDLVFLEIGGRVGGAQIPYIWRDVYGIDLVETWVRMILGDSPDLPDVGVGTEAGGYLLMPEPPVRPCRVLSVARQMGEIPTLYAEVLPSPGDVLSGTGGAKETAGRYRYRAPSSAPIEAAIDATVAGYRLDWEPLPDDHAGVQVKRASGRVQSVVLP